MMMKTMIMVMMMTAMHFALVWIAGIDDHNNDDDDDYDYDDDDGDCDALCTGLDGRHR